MALITFTVNGEAYRLQYFRENVELYYDKPYCALCKTKKENASYSVLIAMAKTWDEVIRFYACGYCVNQSTRKYRVDPGPQSVERALVNKISDTKDVRVCVVDLWEASGRTSIGGFAIRTMKNLEFLVSAYEQDSDVHAITQMVLSLLGLIVFPWEAGFSVVAQEDFLRRHSLRDLEELRMWPHWEITQGKSETQTLYDLIRHVRNAIAHRRLRFSDEYMRELQMVYITFEDKKLRDHAPYWTASINADELREFCVRFVDLMLVKAYFKFD